MVCKCCTNFERITANICSYFHKFYFCPKSPKPWADIAYTIYSGFCVILANTPQYIVYQNTLTQAEWNQRKQRSNMRRTANYATIITYYILYVYRYFKPIYTIYCMPLNRF